MQLVDTRGQLCPMPLILLKKALLEHGCTGEEWHVLTDNETACQNLTDYIKQIAPTVTQKEEGNCTRLIFTPQAEACSTTTAPQNNEDYIVVLSSNTMGRGDDTLGQILARAFVNALEGQEIKPRRIICFNTGVLLAKEGTDTGATLTRLQSEYGVEITLCGTCIDYFGLKDQIAVGTISNMLTIAEYMRLAHRIVTL